MDYRICKKCGENKPLTKYPRHWKKKYYKHTCKDCYNQWTEQRSKRRKRYNYELKRKAIDAYGGHCACCGENRIEFLAIDHIHGNGNEKRRSGEGCGVELYRQLRDANYPKGEYRVLCHNCNISYGLFGYCPHWSVP